MSRNIRANAPKVTLITPRLRQLGEAALADPETGGPVLADALLEAGILDSPKRGKRTTATDAERGRRWLIQQAIRWARGTPTHTTLRTVATPYGAASDWWERRIQEAWPLVMIPPTPEQIEERLVAPFEAELRGLERARERQRIDFVEAWHLTADPKPPTPER